MITLIKIGGSLITDKHIPQSFRAEVMQSIAVELERAFRANDSQWIIGHGSGSFGHVEASKYGTADGASTPEQWYGFCRVAHTAAALNQLVWGMLLDHALPVMRHSPASIALATDGMISSMDVSLIERSLAHGLIPLVHGDVAFDTQRGATIISTETIFTHLAKTLPVSRILLLGEVDGVLDGQKRVIPTITRANFEDYLPFIGGSAGTDVTGGMLTKVADMLALTEIVPGLEIRIFNGLTPGNLTHALAGTAPIGTLIRSA
ncbi:MAG: isopentenyl phosphate kinase [Anaerolineae bacterium]